MTNTIPAHTFEPAKLAAPTGLIPIDQCGHHHSFDDHTGVFCAFPADHKVHAGQDTTIRLRDWTDEEDEN